MGMEGIRKLKKIRLYLALHIFLMIYATSRIFSKLAAGKPFMSLPFILLYGMQIFLLAFYAIGWQQFIKRMPLSVAYANKAVSVIWGCVWGLLIFHEHLTAGKIIGGILVLIGIAIYGYAEGTEEESEPVDRSGGTDKSGGTKRSDDIDHANIIRCKEQMPDE